MRLSANHFAAYAWFTLAYNVLVILWGALVRVTGSGAGCGVNWPSCQGQLIPTGSPLPTWIEFAHRASSGVALVFVLGLFIWAMLAFRRGSVVRRCAGWSLAFILSEAALGAGLVLFGLVAQNSSVARAVVIALHLVNTFLLLGALALSARCSSDAPSVEVQRDAQSKNWVVVLMLGLFVVGASGAVTALGDTLFPMAEMERFAQLGLGNHFLVQLRVWHPVLAVALGAIVLVAALNVSKGQPEARRLARLLAGLFLAQLGLGALNIALKAPLWMQALHLLFADLVWIVFVLLAASLLAFPSKTRQRQPLS